MVAHIEVERTVVFECEASNLPGYDKEEECPNPAFTITVKIAAATEKIAEELIDVVTDRLMDHVSDFGTLAAMFCSEHQNFAGESKEIS